MLVEVTDLQAAKDRIVPVLESQGYDYFWRPTHGDDGPPFYPWFIKRDPATGARTHHIHMVEGHFTEHWDRLLFRDFLIEMPDVAKQYEKLKLRLASKCAGDRLAYTRGKAQFIERVTAQAKRRYRGVVPVLEASIAAIAATSAEARDLMAALDADLGRRYPGHPTHGLRERDLEHPDTMFIVARVEDRAVGCGSARRLGPGVAEIKRMYVRPGYRGRGLARRILEALEAELRDQGITVIRLETGSRQPEALGLYCSAGYEEIAAFGEYVGDPLSRCFEKRLV